MPVDGTFRCRRIDTEDYFHCAGRRRKDRLAVVGLLERMRPLREVLGSRNIAKGLLGCGRKPDRFNSERIHGWPPDSAYFHLDVPAVLAVTRTITPIHESLNDADGLRKTRPTTSRATTSESRPTETLARLPQILILHQRRVRFFVVSCK